MKCNCYIKDGYRCEGNIKCSVEHDYYDGQYFMYKCDKCRDILSFDSDELEKLINRGLDSYEDKKAFNL